MSQAVCQGLPHSLLTLTLLPEGGSLTMPTCRIRALRLREEGTCRSLSAYKGLKPGRSDSERGHFTVWLRTCSGGERGCVCARPQPSSGFGCLLQTHEASIMIKPSRELPSQMAAGLHPGLQEDGKARALASAQPPIQAGACSTRTWNVCDLQGRWPRWQTEEVRTCQLQTLHLSDSTHIRSGHEN